MGKRIRIFTNTGPDASGIISALQKDYYPETADFNGDHVTMTWIKKTSSGEIPEHLYSCGGCKKVTIEKPDGYCSDCAARTVFKKITVEKFLDKVLKE